MNATRATLRPVPAPTRPAPPASVSGPRTAPAVPALGPNRPDGSLSVAPGCATVARNGPQSAQERPSGTGRPGTFLRAPGGFPATPLGASRDGAPLRFDSPTLAAAFGIPLSPRRTLTRCQAETLALAADGLSYRQIARRLFLAEVSVRKRMCRAFLALGVHDKAGAIRAAHEAGLLDLTGGGS